MIEPASLLKATTVKQLDSHTYEASLDASWTIGNVPHGGYVASVFQQVVKKHFETTLREQNQPNSIIVHFEYLRRTEVGPAIFKVKHVKLGRQMSTVHVVLIQKDLEEVFAYVTNSNIAAEKGVTLSTSWQLAPAPPSINLSKLDTDTDSNWGERKHWPFSDFRKAPNHIRFFFPKQGQSHPSVVDQWVCPANGEKWTNESIGIIADAFPQLVEVFHHQPVDVYGLAIQEQMSLAEQERNFKNPGFWYPTMVMNLDIKKALPAEGARWLFVRVQAKSIRNGRYDLEIIIKDETGDLVALSHHVCLAIDQSRNTSKRKSTKL